MWIHLPLGWGRLLQQRRHDWMYETEPVASLDGRRIECARGKVVGGSSSINAMAYVRGNRADYDRWAANGASGWSYAHALPYFRRQERWEGGADAYRGGDGPLATRDVALRGPALRRLLDAARSRRPAGDRRLQRRAAGRLRPHADDDRARPPLQRGGRLPASGAVAPQPRHRNQSPGDPAGARGQPGGGRRVSPAWREDVRPGGAGGDPGGRRDQLAAALDAVRHRRPRRFARARDRRKCSARRRRPQSAGSRCRAHHLCASRGRPVSEEHATRPACRRHRRGLRARHRLCDQSAGRH